MSRRTGRFAAIGAAVIVFALSLLFTARLRFTEDIAVALPDNDSVVRDYLTVVTGFGAMDALYVDIAAADAAAADIGGADAEALAVAAADALHEHLLTIPLVESVRYRTDRRDFLDAMEVLASHRSRLMSGEQLAALEERLTPEAIARSLASARRTLTEPSGVVLRDQIRRDPFWMDAMVLSSLKDFGRELGGGESTDGRLWSRDGRHILVSVRPGFPNTDTQKGERLLADLDRAREAALAAVPPMSVRITCIGGHRAALMNATQVKRDVRKTMLAASLGVLLLGVLFFRHRLFVILVFLPAAFGTAFSTGLCGLVHPDISAISVGFGAVLIGITVDYGVHILYPLDSPETARLDPRTWARSMLLPLAAAATTTMGGLLSLQASSAPGQRALGVLASVGILGAVLFAVLVLPHCVPRTRKEPGAALLPLAALWPAFLRWRDRGPGRVGVVLAGALILILVGLPRVRFEDDLAALDYQTAGYRDEMEAFEQTWGRSDLTAVLTRGASLDEALEQNERVFAGLNELRRQGLVESVLSISPFLPSPRMQEGNRDRWEAFWSEERRAAVREEMRKGSALGFSADAFEPFVRSLDEDPPPLTLSDLEDTGLNEVLSRLIAEADGEVLVLTPVTLAERAASGEGLERVSAALPGASLLTRRRFLERFGQIVRSDTRKLALVAMGVLLACLYALLGAWELALAAIVPVVLSVLSTLATLGLLGVPVNAVSSVFVVFVLGIGLDYSVILVSSAIASLRGQDMPPATTLGSVLMCALTTIAGFISMAFAEHPALLSVGLTGAAGISWSLLYGVLVAPLLVGKLLPAGGDPRAPSLKTFGGALWVYGVLFVMGVVYLAVLRPCLRLRYWHDAEARRRFARRYLHLMAATVVRFLPYLGSRRVYVDADAEALRKPGVLVSNHNSGSDIMMLLALPTEMVMVVKPWVWNAPLMGRLVRSAGYVCPAPGEPESFLRDAANALSRGVCVVVFPEGTRSSDGRMQRFHKGAFELACRTGSDVIPVLLTDTRSCLARNAAWIGDHHCIVRVLPRVTPQTFDYAGGARALGREVKGRLLAQQDEDRRLSQAGPAFRRNVRALYRYRGACAERHVAWRLRFDPLCRCIDDMVPGDAAVLDIGCGYGLLSNILARRSPRRRIAAIDADERKIAVAASTVSPSQSVRFCHADPLECPLPESDVVLLVDALRGRPPEDRRRVIARAAAALRDNGRVVFRDLDGPRFLRHPLAALTRWLCALAGGRNGHTRDRRCARNSCVQAFADAGLMPWEEQPAVGNGSDGTTVFVKRTPRHAT